MGIFRRIGDWLTEKSERFIRGEAEGPGSYYGSSEAEQAYGGMDREIAQEPQEGEDAPRRQPLDPFGHGEGEYGGRVPYRSRYDRERETQRPAAPQQAPAQQADPQQQIPHPLSEKKPGHALASPVRDVYAPAGENLPVPARDGLIRPKGPAEQGIILFQAG